MIGLVACSSQKLAHAAPARRLYNSPLFRASLAYAERRCMQTFIVSAAHGLVGVDEFIEPYNRRLGRKAERAQWGRRIVAELGNKAASRRTRTSSCSPARTTPVRFARRCATPAGRARCTSTERATACGCTCEACCDCRVPRDGYVCNFCGKADQQVKRMISGPRAAICDGCVGLCIDILDAQEAA